MAAPPDTESLESRINRATNPLNRDTDWEGIHALCDQLNNDLEGPQLATRLLAHKIQSPQEWEAAQALLVLEMCMKDCGKRFHNEVGKFRFLNELIKVVSPKYLGSRSPEAVKKKVLELIYSWTLSLPDETKIADAYQMLKKQGMVKQDPDLPPGQLWLPPPPRPRSAVFEDEEKSKVLSRLLNSTHPDDLKAANKLIKEMVQEDQRRAEKVSRRVNTIQEVKESVGLLTQLLEEHDGSSSSLELLQDLYQRCEKMRPTLFRLASDTEDNDEALAEILQANDSVTQVINRYKQQVKGEEVNGNSSTDYRLAGSSCTALLDLSGLDTSPQSPPSFPEFPTPTDSTNAPSQEMGLSLLDDELMSLGLSEGTLTSAASQPDDSTAWDSFQSSDSVEADVPAAPSLLLSPDPPALSQATSSSATTPSSSAPNSSAPNSSAPSSSAPNSSAPNRSAPSSSAPSSSAPSSSAPNSSAPSSSALDELDLLGKALLQQSLPPEGLQVKWDKQQSRPTLRDLQSKSGSNPSPSPIPAFTSEHSGALLNSQSSLGATLLGMSPVHTEAPPPVVSLTDVLVPLESIRPSSLLPVTVFDGHSLRVLFHFARDAPPSCPGVLVVIVSMLSSAPVPITNIHLHTSAPQGMTVKLQPPSGTELPAFNPILPPTAITQVLLLANPLKEQVHLDYRLSFTLGDEEHHKTGRVQHFPPADTWGTL